MCSPRQAIATTQENVMRGTGSFIRSGCVIFQRLQKATRATPVSNFPFLSNLYSGQDFSVCSQCALTDFLSYLCDALEQCLRYMA